MPRTLPFCHIDQFFTHTERPLSAILANAEPRHASRASGGDPRADQQRDGLRGARAILASQHAEGRCRWFMCGHKGGRTDGCRDRDVPAHIDLLVECPCGPNSYYQYAGTPAGWKNWQLKKKKDLMTSDLLTAPRHPHKFLLAFGVLEGDAVTEKWCDPDFEWAFIPDELLALLPTQ